MNDLQIDYFMAVATNSSFTKTSEELFVSQPAISKQIAMMEKELGAKLFYRNNKHTELTEAGKKYYDFFSRYKAELGNIKHEVSELEGHINQVITIGILEGWDFSSWLPEIIEKFKVKHKNTDVILSYTGAKELSTMLLTDEIDMLITLRSTIDSFVELETGNIFKTRKKLIYSKRNKIASKADPTPKDFVNERFFGLWNLMDELVIQKINAYLQPYGFRPKIKLVNNFETLINCVKCNLGIAVCDENTNFINDPELAFINLDEEEYVSAGIMKSSTNNEVRDLFEMIKSLYNI